MEGGNFVDYVKVHCRSGKGGSGSAHFRREKFIPKGGPDGGDGGRGGHVIIRGNAQLWTLLHLKFKKHIKAPHGMPGGGALKTGASGKDMILEVPLGTIAKDVETGERLFEILDDGQEEILIPGGRGGLGNNNFKTATNQTPRYAQPGEDYEEGWKILELKVLADVGLVGFPNAGKSTLLSVVSAAKPKIANYPFTTIVPNLGMVYYRDDRSFVMADIPGIIEGAHEGKGLGARFLRHIERNAALMFMVPADSENITKEYEVLLNELEKHDSNMLHKKRLLGISKADLLDDELKELLKEDLPKDVECLFFSSVTQNGITELKDALWELMQESY
ncbi:MAG: GTPase ObgE [Bacteroidetes bacterium]|nr:GTPase ObgE [Bacteroidota bacterium]